VGEFVAPSTVGVAVGATVGDVGAAVGSSDGAGVGDAVGATVGAAVFSHKCLRDGHSAESSWLRWSLRVMYPAGHSQSYLYPVVGVHVAFASELVQHQCVPITQW
jgi:hypothetical protein